MRQICVVSQIPLSCTYCKIVYQLVNVLHFPSCRSSRIHLRSRGFSREDRFVIYDASTIVFLVSVWIFHIPPIRTEPGGVAIKGSHFYSPHRAAVNVDDEFRDEGYQQQPNEERRSSRFTPGDYAYRPLANVPRRIHLLGPGSIGKLVAHSIRSLPSPPPVTLIFHKFGLLNDWREEKEGIKITTDGITETKDGFDIEVSVPPELEHGKIAKLNSYRENAETSGAEETGSKTYNNSDRPRAPSGKYESDEPIYNLIVCVKTWQTASALLALRHRLTINSTICFLQNGMGVVNEVNEKVFPNEATRPAYIFGIVSHGVHTDQLSKFSATHAGFGTIQLGIMPRYSFPTSPSGPVNQDSDELSDFSSLDPAHTTAEPPSAPQEKKEVLWSPTSRYTLRTLTRVPVLCAVGLSPHDLLIAQLEKLAINCIINPLTVLLDARNGSILFNYALTRAMRLLIAEISLVFRSLPELQGTPNLRLKFSPDRLETLVVSAANATRENISSMLADVRAGRQTEIEYINGYVVRRGEELGIRCAMNYLVMQLVQGKKQLLTREVRDEVPMVGSEEREMRNERSKL